MLWFVKKPNEKLQRYVIIFLWKVIYVHFYSWNRPLDLVLVVYNLIELIIEISLWTKDYSTFDTHTQHTRLLIQWVRISFCVIVYVQMWCVYSIAFRSNPKRLLSILYVFESVFMLSCFEFLFKLHFSYFSSKNFFNCIFARSSRLSSCRENELRQNMKIQNSDKNFHNCLAIVSRVKSSREKFYALEAFFASNFARSQPIKNTCFQF